MPNDREARALCPCRNCFTDGYYPGACRKDQIALALQSATQGQCERCEKLEALLSRSVAKMRILLGKTGHVYSAGENAGWLIADINKALAKPEG